MATRKLTIMTSLRAIAIADRKVNASLLAVENRVRHAATEIMVLQDKLAKLRGDAQHAIRYLNDARKYDLDSIDVLVEHERRYRENRREVRKSRSVEIKTVSKIKD